MAEGDESGATDRPSSVAVVLLETAVVTALTLFLSLRLSLPIVWLLVPLAIIILRGESSSDYGFDLHFRPPSWTTHLLLGGSLLLFYAALHAGFAYFVLGLRFTPSPPTGFSARALGFELATEFLAIGIPEEAFFRGYFQTRWNRALGRRWELFGARVGPGFLLQAAVFALCHLATGDWTRLRVFFFALLAGWLRERSGSIVAPAAYHGVANVWYRLLTSSFR